jgi:hypothetical protein
MTLGICFQPFQGGKKQINNFLPKIQSSFKVQPQLTLLVGQNVVTLTLGL